MSEHDGYHISWNPSLRAYFYYVIIFWKNLNEHLSHLRETTPCDCEVILNLKLSNFSFAQSKIRYLSHIVDKVVIAIDPPKAKFVTHSLNECVRNCCNLLANKTRLKSFLALTTYYCRFIYKDDYISPVLYVTTSKNRGIKWAA